MAKEEDLKVDCPDGCGMLPIGDGDNKDIFHFNVPIEQIPGFKPDVPQMLAHGPCNGVNGLGWVDIKLVEAITCISVDNSQLRTIEFGVLPSDTTFEIQRIYIATPYIEDADDCVVGATSCDGIPPAPLYVSGEPLRPCDVFPGILKEYAIRYFNQPGPCIPLFNANRNQILIHTATCPGKEYPGYPSLTWSTLGCEFVGHCVFWDVNYVGPEITNDYEFDVNHFNVSFVLDRSSIPVLRAQSVSYDIIIDPITGDPVIDPDTGLPKIGPPRQGESPRPPKAPTIYPPVATPLPSPTPSNSPAGGPVPVPIPGPGGPGPIPIPIPIPVFPPATPTLTATATASRTWSLSPSATRTPTISVTSSPTATPCWDCTMFYNQCDGKSLEGQPGDDIKYFNQPINQIACYDPNKVQVLVHNRKRGDGGTPAEINSLLEYPTEGSCEDGPDGALMWADFTCVEIASSGIMEASRFGVTRKKIGVINFFEENSDCYIVGNLCPAPKPTPSVSKPRPTPSLSPSAPPEDDPQPPYRPPYPDCDCPDGFEKETGDSPGVCGLCCPVDFSICTNPNCPPFGLCVPDYLMAAYCGDCVGPTPPPPPANCPPLSNGDPPECGDPEPLANGQTFGASPTVVGKANWDAGVTNAATTIPITPNSNLKIHYTINLAGVGVAFEIEIKIKNNLNGEVLGTIPLAQPNGNKITGDYCICMPEDVTEVYFYINNALGIIGGTIELSKEGCCPVPPHVVGLALPCPDGWEEEWTCVGTPSVRVCCPEGMSVCLKEGDLYGLCVHDEEVCSNDQCDPSPLRDPTNNPGTSCDDENPLIYTNVLSLPLQDRGFVTQHSYPLTRDLQVYRISWKFTPIDAYLPGAVWGSVTAIQGFSWDLEGNPSSPNAYAPEGYMLVASKGSPNPGKIEVAGINVVYEITIECVNCFDTTILPAVNYWVHGCPEGWDWVKSGTYNGQLIWWCCPDGWWLCEKGGADYGRCVPPEECWIEGGSFCGGQPGEDLRPDPCQDMGLPNEYLKDFYTTNISSVQHRYPAEIFQQHIESNWDADGNPENDNSRPPEVGVITWQVSFQYFSPNLDGSIPEDAGQSIFRIRDYDPFDPNNTKIRASYVFDPLADGEFKTVFWQECFDRNEQGDIYYTLDLAPNHGVARVLISQERRNAGSNIGAMCPFITVPFYCGTDCGTTMTQQGEFIARNGKTYVYCCPDYHYICLEPGEFFGLCVPDLEQIFIRYPYMNQEEATRLYGGLCS